MQWKRTAIELHLLDKSVMFARDTFQPIPCRLYQLDLSEGMAKAIILLYVQAYFIHLFFS